MTCNRTRALALAAALLACGKAGSSDPKPTSKLPELEELPAWPPAGAPRTFPPAGVELVPAIVRGHANRRTPSPDAIREGTARAVTDGLFAALGSSLANRKGTAADVDFNLVPILRMRPSGAPQPNAILVMIPGLYAGATSFLSLGSELVLAAREKGVVLEVWAIDRRSNLLEDRSGLLAAAAAADPSLVLDYYGLSGREPKEVAGRRYVAPPHKDFLFQAEWGLDTHLRDYRAVVLLAKERAGKVFLGGHSLGGMQTGIYLGYDFAAKGKPESLGAADLAGAILIDAPLKPRAGSEEEALKTFVNGGDVGGFGIPAPGIRELRTPRDGDTLEGTYLSVKGVIGPPLLQQIGGLGVGAVFAPEATAKIALPSVLVVGSSGAKTIVGSYAAVFPATLDDDFIAIEGLRFSLGFPDGAPESLQPGVRKKDRTNPFGLFAIGETSEAKPLRWLDHKAVGLKPKHADVPQYGVAEVVDLRTAAQAVVGGPTHDFLEWFFPLRLLHDIQLAVELGLDTARLSDGDTGNDQGAEAEMTRFGEPGLRLVGLSRADAPVLALRGEYGVLQGDAGPADSKAGEETLRDFARLLAPGRGDKARLAADGSFGPGFVVKTLAEYTHNDVLFAEPNGCVPPILAFLLGQ